MPLLRPVLWLLYSPIMVLPLLAALVIERPLLRRADRWFNLADYGALLQHHAFWLLVALGLGIWVGWYTAAVRKPEKAPAEEGAP